MPSTYSAQLLALEGPDALAFAQAQFSNNLLALGDGQWQFGAWLDAQGRVRALFHLVRLDGQCLRLLLRGGDATFLAGELQRYVFRAKVRITALPTQQLATVGAMALHTAQEHDGRLLLGCASHGLMLGAEGDDGWRLPQLRARWPWLPPGALGELLPAWLDLGGLDATALDKGCYPGQEIVARMHYRGGSKRQLHRVSLSCPLPPGSVLDVGGHAPLQLLDVVPVDDVAEALAVVHEGLRLDVAAGVETRHGSQVVLVRAVEPDPLPSPSD